MYLGAIIVLMLVLPLLSVAAEAPMSMPQKYCIATFQQAAR